MRRSVEEFCALQWTDPPDRMQRHRQLAQDAVAFLAWEAGDPNRWRAMPAPPSPWTLKQAVLEGFCSQGVTPSTVTPLRDLIIGALYRQQRCMDHLYWQLARSLDDADLRSRILRVAGTSGQEPVRLRAGFLLWLLDHTERHTDGRGWRQWLRAEGRPLPDHLAGLGISSLRRPADAVAVLAGMPTLEIAAVLESLDLGPATQIAAMLDPQSAADALSGMSARRATQTLRGMAEPAAAAILQRMEPACAAARMPGASRIGIPNFMNHDAAVRCLRLMPPPQVADRLRWLTPTLQAALRKREKR
jgi:hypothetical protein